VHRQGGRAGDGDGPLLGETITFTGALEIPRRVAADQAADAGADVAPGVTRRTTMLVVGDQDISKLNGGAKSSKHLKAEELIAQGHAIRIMGETDFMALSTSHN
jgi:DNA polymerase-3 subunit epsilon